MHGLLLWIPWVVGLVAIMFSLLVVLLAFFGAATHRHDAEEDLGGPAAPVTELHRRQR